MRYARSLLIALLVLAAASLCLTLASPAQARKTPQVTKFASSAAWEVGIVARINRQVNDAITYTSDMDNYGVPEKWVLEPANGKGDCEDYALTKMERLRALHFPAATRAKIRFVMVGIEAHVILEIRLSSNESAFLDNKHPQLMTRAELERLGYRFYDW